MLRLAYRVLPAIAALSLASACAVHDPEPAFRASVFIGDRGISIPLPPPSLIDQPKQDVDVRGEVIGLAEQSDDWLVRIVDVVGGEEIEVSLSPGSSRFEAVGLPVDLTANCLELWLEHSDGRQSERRSYEARIGDDGQTISVAAGCD